MKVKFLKAILDEMCPDGDVFFEMDCDCLQQYAEAIFVNQTDLNMLNHFKVEYCYIGCKQDETLWIYLRPNEPDAVEKRSDEFYRKYELKEKQQ